MGRSLVYRARKVVHACLASVLTAGVVTLAGAAVLPTAAHAGSGSVLILDPTVSGGASGIEGSYLSSLGYTVNDVNAATWASMTASQFASYQAIVLGDPTCVYDPSPMDAAVANESTWAPVVTGNTIIVGTDPVYHYTTGTPGALTLIQKGLDFAAGQPGKTGLFLDLSCYYNNGLANQSAPILDGLEAGFQLTSPGCFDTIHVVATNPLITGLTDTDLSNWGCSVHEYMNAWPSDFVPIAIDTAAFPPVYTAPDGTMGDPYIMGRGAGLAAGSIDLNPPTGTQSVGVNYTLTATVQSGGTGVTGATVTFTAISGPNSGNTGTAVTDSSGNAPFTYTSPTTGTDTWQASFVDSAGHTETSNNATVTWTTTVAPTTTTTSLAGGGQTGTSISVPSGTAVSDTASIAGTGVATAGGTVKYMVYSDSTCTTQVGTSTVSVTSGSVPTSTPVSLTVAGTYYWVATYSGDPTNGASASGCGSEVETVTPLVNNPPTCTLTGVIAGPPAQIQVTVQDTSSGLSSITVTGSSNDTVNVPSFTPGTTSPVVVTATKIDQATTATLALQVTDVNGLVTNCDPAVVRVNQKAAQSLSLRQKEHYATIRNHGLKALLISVDGERLAVKLNSPHGTTTVNLAQLFRTSRGNKITITGVGPGNATVALSD